MDRLRIELRFLECKSSIIPLNYQPEKQWTESNCRLKDMSLMNYRYTTLLYYLCAQNVLFEPRKNNYLEQLNEV